MSKKHTSQKELREAGAASRERTALKLVAPVEPKKAASIKAPPTVADAKMAEQLKEQLSKKTKPSDGSLASQAMEYADKALAWADFTRKVRHSEAVDGGLVSAALEYATAEHARDVAEKLDVLTPEQYSSFLEDVTTGAHPFSSLYLATHKAMRETAERLGDTNRMPQRLKDRLNLILGCASVVTAEKLAQNALRSAELFYYVEWGKIKLASTDTKRDFKTLSALADFLNAKGQSVKASQVKSEAEQGAKPEPDYSKLSPGEVALVNAIKNAGGSATTEFIKGGFAKQTWNIKDMSRLMDQKVLSTPREGVVRLDESKLLPPAAPPAAKVYGDGKQGPPRKSQAVKAPKPEAPHKWQKLVREGTGQEAWECADCKLTSATMDDTLKLGCKGAPKPPRASGANKPIINPQGKCLCGCGADVKTTSRFGIGHDAKLHSAVLKAAKGDKVILAGLPLKNETSVAYLKQAPWMTPEVLKAIGL